MTPEFKALLQHHKLPMPEEELRFAPPRKWRFDYAWSHASIALEVDGGVWTRGRHTRGSGFLKDMEKFNRAAVLGWGVLRVTPKTLAKMDTIRMLKEVL